MPTATDRAALGYAIAAPSDSDWVVTLWKAGGANIVLRVSPGNVEREEALRKAIMSCRWNPAEVVDVTVERASDRSKVIAGDVEAEFARLQGIIRRNAKC